jgi:cytochrome c-type biogenesis protein CcmF
MMGTLGHAGLLVAFVAAAAATASFFVSTLRATRGQAGADVWTRRGRLAWMGMAAGAAVSSVVMWVLLFGRHFEYGYPWQHTSHAMPFGYTLSSFWAGQEGSFLLWALMATAVGAAVLGWARGGKTETARADRRLFEAPVMAVLALGQVFLFSMIVGLKLGALHVGADPFITLAEKFPDAPMLQQPGFVPEDGQGLNDLLQNPWMVIHPPTLFAGFSLMAVPFAFAIAGLWLRKYTQWVRPSLPWTLGAIGVLGLGIMMGGYWAYVTLSFGGWWAWDPVENSSFVPWLFAAAALHAMLVQRKQAAAHRSALLLTVVAYALIVYSTFLTRSGILGDVSVHSFVDLGLYNQLLLWIGSIFGLGFGLYAWRYRELPRPSNPPSALSRESMILTGALLLALVGLVIALGTSSPILGRLFRDNPSAVPIAFYNAWTLPLAIAIAFLAGLGQLFWWRKMEVEEVNRALMKPLALTVASTAAVLLLTPFVQETVQPAPMAAAGMPAEAGLLPGALGTFFSTHGTSLLLLLLLFASFFALYGNASVFWRVARGNPRLAGGSLAHVGFGLVMLGIFGSSVFNTPITDGNGADVGGQRENFVAPRGETVSVAGYTVAFTGTEVTAEGRPVYVLDWTSPRGESFQTRNVVYKDHRDQWIQHPFVREGFMRDLYVAAFPRAMSEEPDAAGELLMRRGETAALRDASGTDRFDVRFVDYDLDVSPAEFDLPADSVDLTIGAILEVTDRTSGETRTLTPVYAIGTDRRPRFVQFRAPDWGLALTFAGMQVEDNAIRLVVEGAQVPQADWVIVQAYEKPFISVLWIGTLVLLAGVAMAVRRRASET